MHALRCRKEVIMNEDKLIFHRPAKSRKHNKSTIVRLSPEAFDLLTDWESATGHSLTYLASEMIKFADSHAVLSDEAESEEEADA